MADQADFERMKDLLKEKILQRLPEPGLFETAIPGLGFFRRDTLVEKEKCFFSPVIAVVLQGRKRSIIGNEEYHYGEDDCFITGMDLPAVTSVIKASAKSPLISFGIKLDRYLIAELLAEMGNNSGAVKDNPRTAVSVARVEQSVLDAFIRLINLLETPEQIPILSPLIMREIHYRLLIGPQGGILHTVSALGTPRNRIAEAITWLRENYYYTFPC
ncbi:hypothetical protein AGMMS50230_22020 [Spirochaetia bacterium]|nr:hypothetical protein AGMMS50230_22020 [Spirochaetia bacterium]